MEKNIVQSVLFNKHNISLNHAIDWLKNHDYKVKKVDETPNLLRFRQWSPTTLKKLGYNGYFHKKLNDDVSLVIAYKH
jgi:hypothetical protein